MKRIYLFLIFFVSILVVKAQDTIKTQDMPNPGDIYAISIGDTFPGIDVVSTGANHTWDFSALTRRSQRMDSILNPIQTDTLLSFYFFNFPLNSNRANLAARSSNFTLGVGPGIVGFNDVYNYYYNSSPDFHQCGFGAVVNNIPMPIGFTPHDVQYIFPLKYGDEDSTSFSYEVDLTSSIGVYVSAQKKRHNLVDGWGSLTTPYGTFDVLRIKSTVTEIDSFYISLIQQGFKTPLPTIIEYKWLSPGLGEPMLQINTSAANVISQILYQDSVHTIGISEIISFAGDPIVFPNPAVDFVVVRYNLQQKTDVNFSLFTLEGNQVFNLSEQQNFAGENTKFVDLRDYNLSKGNYILKVKAGREEISKILNVGK